MTWSSQPRGGAMASFSPPRARTSACALWTRALQSPWWPALTATRASRTPGWCGSETRRGFWLQVEWRTYFRLFLRCWEYFPRCVQSFLSGGQGGDVWFEVSEIWLFHFELIYKVLNENSKLLIKKVGRNEILLKFFIRNSIFIFICRRKFVRVIKRNWFVRK